jgi:predicted helicase
MPQLTVSFNSNFVLDSAMSLKIIQQYYNEKFKLKNLAKQDSESVLRRAFARVLEGFAAKLNLTLVEEVSFKTVSNHLIRFDGVLKNEMGLDFGYWEAKAKVDLEDEIRKKFNKGYPKSNILFEDGVNAVLFQDGERVLTVAMQEAEALNELLQQFFAFETRELRDFRQAVADFKKDVPTIVETLRDMIDAQNIDNHLFKKARTQFLDICREAINPEVGAEDVNEMLIQHILTEQIFIAVFSDDQLVRENNIARSLYEMEATFFKGNIKRNVLYKIKNYYEVIAIAAKQLVSHTEKQFFLKKVYENFYKAYNPKGADKLGIVYTPSEIVKFQINATEYLLETHFGKTLSDRGVEILDPATGTGTYICELIEHLSPMDLEYKFKNELFANEISILPYYIANLNIEYTFRNKNLNKVYESFPNLCFVDTLDNIGGLGWMGKQFDIFGISAENTARIKRQNDSKISVIIGNPPYNANQQNENDNNKNRTYFAHAKKQTGGIDGRIKDTFIKHSTAQKTKVYDMYARFFRWAFDRLQQDGIISFITNRSFIDAKTFDGFRKCVQMEFDYAYIIDLQSDVRANPKIAGTTHNVFGIQTGVAILFLVKKRQMIPITSARFETSPTLPPPCRIYYRALDDFWKKEEKLDWLRENEMHNIDFKRIIPDKNNNWLNLTDNDFETLMPVCNKEVKLGKGGEAIFELFSLGVATNRDEWVYDFDDKNLKNKTQFFCDFFEKEKIRWQNSNKSEKLIDFVDRTIKWTEELENHLFRNSALTFDEKNVVQSQYRPFVKKHFYFGKIITHRIYQNEIIFDYQSKNKNVCICFSGIASSKSFQALVVNQVTGLDFLEKTNCLPLYVYNKNGEKQDNITDWALQQFENQYLTKSVANNNLRQVSNLPQVSITKERIFYYVYAVLHAPAYRAAYEQNLKRDFPRIPLYENFDFYAEQGQKLADLHIGYENATPYPLQIIEKQIVTPFVPKAKLKADKTNGLIEIDELTTLQGIPEAAWQYQLGNRSALEWVLDQYKESKPTDKTILEHFNSYRFADYKQKVIDLLMRVCRVSVETVNIIHRF